MKMKIEKISVVDQTIDWLKEYIEERAVEIACYIIEHKATVRQAAGKFGVSKSTIHIEVII